MGRFISEDTYEGDIKNPLSLNLYTYVENNPLKYSDPSGHMPVLEMGEGGSDRSYAENPTGWMLNMFKSIGYNLTGRQKAEIYSYFTFQDMSYREMTAMSFEDFLATGAGIVGVLATSGTGKYGQVGGHHVHAKAAFKNHITYDSKKGFSISQEFMLQNGLDHNRMTSMQRKLFKELAQSGRPNTIYEHNRIAVEALIAGGASRDFARQLVAQSLVNLRNQGVRVPTNIPWY